MFHWNYFDFNGISLSQGSSLFFLHNFILLSNQKCVHFYKETFHYSILFYFQSGNLTKNAISDGDKKGFTDSMNDFTQDFLAVSWNELGDNYVFSPFSLHSVLAMLTTGATNGSQTQKELLLGFGRNSKIDVLEKLYGQFVKDYKVK